VLSFSNVRHPSDTHGSQTPHCEGRNVDRRLFNKRTAGANRSLSLGFYDDKAGELVLNLGDAHGVIPGSVYGVHASILDPGPTNPQLCTLVITRVDSLRSIMGFPPDDAYDIPDLFYAKKIKNGPGQPFAIYCSEGDLMERVFPDRQSRDTLGVMLVSSPDSADLSILVDKTNRTANFERHNPSVTRHIGSRFPFTESIDDYSRLRSVVECAINFNRHLKSSGEDMRNVWVELQELEFEDSFTSDGQRVARMGPNLLENDTATAPINRSFTLTIFNQTDLSLYPHVFFLDPSELSIGEVSFALCKYKLNEHGTGAWYTPAIGGHPGKSGLIDPPILPKSAMTLGYGDTATEPWTFGLRPGEKVDVGFFKVFFTTSPSDFSTLIQHSPFDPPFSVALSRTGQVMKAPSPPVEFWGTKLVTVIHKEL
jgi:hypothetical protein